ncbi:hypothetical protein Fcan01_16670 [Folsomia candida]|uniref:Uncharacterized protein n=1 Tax=Folsomia candida TaxID=158441 RepID=A0A226DUS5_FOLCA|nr:hypothetical protein Fcan01_16670 [Folsomia candida]
MKQNKISGVIILLIYVPTVAVTFLEFNTLINEALHASNYIHVSTEIYRPTDILQDFLKSNQDKAITWSISTNISASQHYLINMKKQPTLEVVIYNSSSSPQSSSIPQLSSIPAIFLLPTYFKTTSILPNLSRRPLFVYFYHFVENVGIIEIASRKVKSPLNTLLEIPTELKTVSAIYAYRQRLWNDQQGNKIAMLADWGYYKPSNRSSCLNYLQYRITICSYQDALAQNMATFYNFSTVFLPSENAPTVEEPSLASTTGIIMFGSVKVGSIINSAPCETELTPRCISNFLYRGVYKFVYCDRPETRETLSLTNFALWSNPFPNSIWILILVTSGAIFVVSFKTIQFFDVVAILLRQDHWEEKGTLLLCLFSLMSSIVTSSYESRVTSGVIVPFGPKIIQSVSKLMSGGYKIIAVPDLSPILLTAYKEVFQRAGITERFNNSFFFWENHPSDVSSVLRHGNTTQRNAMGNWDLAILRTEQTESSPRCYVVPNDPMLVDEHISFIDRLRTEFYSLLELFRQSGLIMQYFSHEVRLKEKSFAMKWEERAFKNKLPVKLSLKMGKINSVFTIFVILVGLDVLSFAVEIVLKMKVERFVKE